MQEVKIAEGAVLKNGLIVVETKTSFLNLFDAVKEQGAEIFYLNKIKDLENFKSLRPFFRDGEDQEFKDFIIKKHKRKALNNNLYKNKTSTKTNLDYDIEIDDDVIIDNNFAILLNEDREILVKGKLYKYRADGVFVLEESLVPVFRDYLEDSTTSNSLHTDADFGFIEMDYLVHAPIEEPYTGGGSGASSNVIPDFYEAKLSFPTKEFNKNPSLWGQTFGYGVKEYISVPDDKRVKLKYWNRNYVLVQTLGTEIRFQKKVKFLFITGWQKSYPDKVALGINTINFNYDLSATQYLTRIIHRIYILADIPILFFSDNYFFKI